MNPRRIRIGLTLVAVATAATVVFFVKRSGTEFVRDVPEPAGVAEPPIDGPELAAAGRGPRSTGPAVKRPPPTGAELDEMFARFSADLRSGEKARGMAAIKALRGIDYDPRHGKLVRSVLAFCASETDAEFASVLCMWCAFALADFGPAAFDEIVEAVLEPMKPNQRYAASRALIKGGEPGLARLAAVATRLLVDGASRENDLAEVAASLAAEEATRASPTAARILGDCLASPSRTVVFTALATLGSMPGTAAVAMTAIARWTTDATADADIQLEAARAMWAATGDPAPLIRHIGVGKALPALHSMRRARAFGILTDLGDAAVPRLREMILGDDADSAAHATAALVKMDPPQVAVVREFLGSPTVGTRHAVLVAIHRSPALGLQLLPEIDHFTRSTDDSERQAAFGVLGKYLLAGHPELVSHLTPALADSVTTIRIGALRSLVDDSALALAALDAVRPLAESDPEASVRDLAKKVIEQAESAR